MSQQAGSHFYYRVGDFLLDLKQGQLINGSSNSLLPKLTREVFACLIRNYPNVVTQDDLINTAWQGLSVTDENLQQRIKLIRKMLKDSSRKPKYIQTIRGIGYQLIAEVKPVSPELFSGDQISQTDNQNSFTNRLSLICQKLFFSNTAPIEMTSWLQNFRQKINYPVLISSISILTIAALFDLIMHDHFSKTHSVQHQPIQTITAQTKPTTILQESATELYLKGIDYYQRYRKLDNSIAIDLFTRALKKNPNYAPAYAGLANAYLQGVYQFDLERNHIDSALLLIEQGLQVDQELAELYKAKGFALALQGQYNKSLVAYHQAVRLNPQLLNAITNMAYNYRELGMLVEALHWHKKAIALAPEKASGYQHLAQTYAALNLYTQAEEWFLKSIQLRPDYSLGKIFYGHFLIASGRFDEALALGKNLLSAQPNYIKSNNLVADALYFSGRFEEAVPYYISAENTVGRTLDYANYRLGIIFSSLGKTKLASARLDRLLAEWQLQIEQGNDDPEIKMRVASIYAAKKESNKAIYWLQSAFDSGWVKADVTFRDPAFSILKNNSEFQTIRQIMYERIRQMKQIALESESELFLGTIANQ